MFVKPGCFEGGSNIAVNNPYSYETIDVQRRLLPIFQYRKHLLYLVEKCRVVIVVGETGCGKTTQIPQYLLEAGWANGGRVVGCTQPRRVACMTTAHRVAEEQHTTLGARVGYTIRFDNHSTKDVTQIKYITDGMMIREILGDPLLSTYSVIMVDEAHERGLNSDVLLGLLKRVMRKRPQLRLVVASATLEAEVFREFFSTGLTAEGSTDKNKVSLLSIKGQCYPVDVKYAQQPCRNYVQAAVALTLEIHKNKPPGDILVFLPGSLEIDTMVGEVNNNAERLPGNKQIVALPLYAQLSMDEQLQAFKPSTNFQRKVIVATNIAETSVTIPGIVYVIDTGFVKLMAYSPQHGTERLVLTHTSQAEATQRAGRAGRVQSGECYRLYTEQYFEEKMASHAIPEMLRTNLASTVVQLKGVGVENPLHFNFISNPPKSSFVKALELLYCLGAIDDQAKLTENIGMKLADFPTEPLTTKFLLCAFAMDLADEGCKIAAMISVQNIWLHGRTQRDKQVETRRIYAVVQGDFITYLNLMNAWEENDCTSDWCRENGLNYRAMKRCAELKKQLYRYSKRVKDFPDVKALLALAAADDPEEEFLRKISVCLIAGFFAHAAHVQPDGSYVSVHGGLNLRIHPNSVLVSQPPAWVVYYEIIETDGMMYMKECMAVKQPIWLVQIAPHFYNYTSKHSQTFEGRTETNVGSFSAAPVDKADMHRKSNWLFLDGGSPLK